MADKECIDGAPYHITVYTLKQRVAANLPAHKFAGYSLRRPGVPELPQQ